LTDYFRVDPLGSVYHNEETRLILSKLPIGDKSQYIRDAIIWLALKSGFILNGNKEWLEAYKHLADEHKYMKHGSLVKMALVEYSKDRN
jgi:hypothetical protein